MPTILRKDGFRFFFYSNERTEPTHIHVIGKGGEMKFWIPSMVIEFSYNLSPAEQRNVIKIIKEHVELIKEKWHEFSSKKI